MTTRIAPSLGTGVRRSGLLPLCVALALAGCGGGGGSDNANPNLPNPQPQPQPQPQPEPPVPPPVVMSKGSVSLLTGSTAGSGNLDGAGSAARFSRPLGVALDAQDNLYVADLFNHRIRKVTPAGVVSTVAGSGQAGYADGAASTATFCGPSDVAVDAGNNVFVADSTVVRKIAPDGTVTTVAGVAPAGCGSVEGLAPPNRPRAVAVDRLGFLYIANERPSAVYQLSPSGELTQVAGDETPGSQGDGSLGSPTSIAVDDARNVYVGGAFGNGEGAIFKIAANGNVTSLLPKAAGRPTALAVDRSGTLFFARSYGDTSIGTISPTGAVAVRASGVAGEGIAISADGSILFSGGSTIRRIDPAGNVTDVAGSPEPFGQFFRGSQATDRAGNVYILEQLSQPGSVGLVLQRIAPDGQKTMLLSGVAGAEGLAADDAGNVYLSQSVETGTGCYYRGCFPIYNSEITKLDAQGRTTKLPRLYTDANGAEIALNRINALAVDAAGNLFVSDRGPNDTALYRLTPAGAISTVTTGRFALTDIAVDAQGTHVYASTCPIVNQTGPQIVKYGLSGVSTVLAGSPTESGTADGAGTQATFGSCQLGIALDPDNNVFVADTANSTVRKVAATGEVTTIVGRAGLQGITLGLLPASLSAPTDVSFDGAGNLYVGSAHAVLKVQLSK